MWILREHDIIANLGVNNSQACSLLNWGVIHFRWGISGILSHYSVQYWHHWIAKIEIFATCPCLHGLMHLNLLTQPLQVACLHHVNFTWTWHHSKPGSKQLPGLLPTRVRCNSFQVRLFWDFITLFSAILRPQDSWDWDLCNAPMFAWINAFNAFNASNVHHM